MLIPSTFSLKSSDSIIEIRFVVASSFKEKLKDYGRLHKANCKFFDGAIESFYNEILKDFRRVNVLIEDFRAKVGWSIYWAIKQKHGVQIATKTISLGWNKKGKYAEVTLVEDESLIDSLNQNSELKQKISSTLKDVYRYSGEFRFAVDDFPF